MKFYFNKKKSSYRKGFHYIGSVWFCKCNLDFYHSILGFWFPTFLRNNIEFDKINKHDLVIEVSNDTISHDVISGKCEFPDRLETRDGSPWGIVLSLGPLGVRCAAARCGSGFCHSFRVCFRLDRRLGQTSCSEWRPGIGRFPAVTSFVVKFEWGWAQVECGGFTSDLDLAPSGGDKGRFGTILHRGGSFLWREDGRPWGGLARKSTRYFLIT